jgi:hypothetical protein
MMPTGGLSSDTVNELHRPGEGRRFPVCPGPVRGISLAAPAHGQSRHNDKVDSARHG